MELCLYRVSAQLYWAEVNVIGTSLSIDNARIRLILVAGKQKNLIPNYKGHLGFSPRYLPAYTYYGWSKSNAYL